MSRFKVWISVLKFDLAPKFANLADNINAPNSLSSHADVPRNRNRERERDRDVDGSSSSSGSSSNVASTTWNVNVGGGGAGYHEPSEECNGMLRIWDGPLREIPVCNDLNW